MTLDLLIFDFTFYYPLFMAYLWMTGALAYFIRYELNHDTKVDPLTLLDSTPLVTIVVPCFNEQDNIREVLASLDCLNYPNYEILCVNDGSSDATGEILHGLLDQYPRLRVIEHARNQGKAVGLNTAALVAGGEYVLCIDGDAVLDPDSVAWLMRHFQGDGRVGAVTGNPRIRTRSTLLGRIQVGEFSSIIGLIKRTQRIYGRLFTVSGVIAMFRRRALIQSGLWSADMLTEDIDISWKLQLNHWDVRFEPRALCWILMPETLAGLWKQRLRWAMGGIQVILKYAHIFTVWRYRRMWPVYIEYIASVVWAYAMALVISLSLAGLFVEMPLRWQISAVPGWHGVLIGTTCLLQVLIAMTLDHRYDHRLSGNFVWMIWYPLVYWMLSMATTVVAIPRVLLRARGLRAVWVSPDRGFRGHGEAEEMPGLATLHDAGHPAGQSTVRPYFPRKELM